MLDKTEVTVSKGSFDYNKQPCAVCDKIILPNTNAIHVYNPNFSNLVCSKKCATMYILSKI